MLKTVVLLNNFVENVIIVFQDTLMSKKEQHFFEIRAATNDYFYFD